MSNVIPMPQKAPVIGVEDEIVMMNMDQVMEVLMRRKTVEDIRREKLHEGFLNELRAYDIPDLRRFWDEVSDVDSFYTGPEGSFDCADIHRVLNEKGDGLYCSV